MSKGACCRPNCTEPCASGKARLCKEHRNEYMREFHRRHGDRWKHQATIRRYGLTPADYQAMLDAQAGVCAICGQPETAKYSRDGKNHKVKRLAVDHDHETGVVRALVCQTCNMMLGAVNDDIGRLRVAIAYLERQPKTPQ